MSSTGEDKPASMKIKTLTSTSQAPNDPSSTKIDTVARVIPERSNEVRGSFSSRLTYIMSCVAFSVGLGNIWRFPMIAYRNGGGAFLIPYFFCGLLFGIPGLYIEAVVGQFTQKGPSIAFGQYFPIAQGLGWAIMIAQLTVALFYNVVVAWIIVFYYNLLTGGMSAWDSCDGWWNDRATCVSLNQCNATTVLRNGTCVDRSLLTNETAGHLQLAQEQYFKDFVVRVGHSGMGFGDFNTPLMLALMLSWTLTTLGLLWGTKVLGKISLVTSSVPYIVITIILVYTTTLDGASIGLSYFLTSDFDKIFKLKTWVEALTQMCFSLCIGAGGMTAMGSYNRRSHSALADVIIILFLDSLMSITGGVAVFSVLGFMSKFMNEPIETVVRGGLDLVFITYPVAVFKMACPTVWASLFFTMLFFVGVSTMRGIMQILITCASDLIPWLGEHKKLAVVIMCVPWAVGQLAFLTWQNSFHIVTIMAQFVGDFALPFMALTEMSAVFIGYGLRNFYRDIVVMRGAPTTWFKKIFGSSGIVIKFTTAVTAPALALALGIYLLTNLREKLTMKYERTAGDSFEYPTLAVFAGFILAILVGAIVQCVRYNVSGKGFRALFRPAKEHPAERYPLPAASTIRGLWSLESSQSATPTPSTMTPLKSPSDEKAPQQEG